ncbi:MAG TPA: hypothetical protein VFC67_19395, partial [Prolixibacteraceae bacterium]|nr:hypothetical protein [Prolixibacteraceae bacterium]
ERIDRIPKTRHRWIKIVSLLTSLGFNLKTKLRTKKSIQNTVFTECLRFINAHKLFECMGR